MFKLGDRVRLIESSGGWFLPIGSLGTVYSYYSNSANVGVSWDNLTDGHDGSRKGGVEVNKYKKPGNSCWMVSHHLIEKVSSFSYCEEVTNIQRQKKFFLQL